MVLRSELNGTAIPADLRLSVESAVSASAEPDWDIQEQRDNGEWVVEEVKSGPVSADARRVLWSRIRSTVGANPGVRVVPRLTTNKDNPTDNAEFWKGLAAQSATTSPAKKARVSSAEDLAAEALYYLTSPRKKLVGTPLTKSQARETLSAFRFVDTTGGDTLQNELTELVEVFAKSIGAKQVCDALIGDLTSRAASKDVARRQFSSSEVWSSVELLVGLSTFPVSQVRLWQSLKAASDPAQVLPASRLAYQEWRSVQPQLAAALNSVSPQRLALIGRGGLGKTVTLGRLYDEASSVGPALWVSGSELLGKAPDDVAGAFAIGAVALGATQGKPLPVFIDGFENSTLSTADSRLMLSGLGEANRGRNVRLTLSVRSTTWASMKGSQESVPNWTSCDLKDWDAGLVSRLVSSSQRPSVADELLQLLRTPLLLDLFLRTFGHTEVIPAGLHTRHALLKVFWDRRVLPSLGDDTVQRRVELESACDGEAGGRSEHPLTGTAARALASEGVFIMRRGLYVFRHALLRDFSLLCWATLRSTPRAGVLAVLATISGAIVRWGAVRAAIEAALSTGEMRVGFQALADLLSPQAMRDAQTVDQVAEVLGELEDPSVIDLPRVIRDCSPALDAQFVGRVLVAATISANPGWIAWLAGLPEAGEWPATESWVGPQFFGLVSDYLEATSPGVTANTVSVARRLRSWSSSEKFADALQESEGYRWARLLPLVSTHAPEEATLDWAAANDGRGWRSIWGALESVPLLVVGARNQGLVLPGAKLVSLYLKGAGLAVTPDGIRESSGGNDYQRTNVILLGEGQKNHRGLLRERPEVFLPLAFERLVGLGAEEREERSKWSAGYAEHFNDDDFKPPRSKEVAELEAQLEKEAGPKLTVQDALGGLVDDVELPLANHERDVLVEGIRAILGEMLRDTPNQLRDVYFLAARQGRSATAWTLILEFLVEVHPREAELLREVLSHSPLFHVLEAHPGIHDAIELLWSTLLEAQRDVILTAVKRVAASPTMNGMYCVAPLLSAIPSSVYPPEFAPYFELFRLRGWTPRAARRQPPQISYGSSATELVEEGAGVRPWQALLKTAIGGLAALDESQFQKAIQSLAEVLKSLPEPSAASENLDVFACLENLLGEDWRRHQKGESLLLGSDLATVVDWAFAVLEKNPPDSLNEDRSPVAVESAPQLGTQHPFVLALEVLDVALLWPSLASRREAMFQEIERYLSRPSDSLAWRLLRSVRTWHWMNEGRKTFDRLLEGVGNSPGVLYVAINHVIWTEPKVRTEAIEGWLTSPNRFPDCPEEQVEKFVRHVGEVLGARYAIEAAPVEGSARLLVERQLVRREGALAAVRNRGAFAGGVIFGAKERLLRQQRRCSPDDVNRFGDVCRAVWAQFSESREEDATCVIYVTHALTAGLVMTDGASAQPRLWDALESVFALVAERDSASANFNLVFQLRTLTTLGWTRLSRVVQALILRVSKVDLDEPVQWGHGWRNMLEYACEFLELLAGDERASAETRNLIYDTLQAWGARGVGKALVASRRVRVAAPT